ncbi:hypothetical protein, partial [Streptomyces sp. NPDC056730]|uniref:hypothetical protein n=1 Tax=Streptomyces sp. NPDC056730 TaxID=3345929 RepID=UPI0036CF0EF2
MGLRRRQRLRQGLRLGRRKLLPLRILRILLVRRVRLPLGLLSLEVLSLDRLLPLERLSLGRRERSAVRLTALPRLVRLPVG